jgi:putative endonuclease
VNFSDKEYYVYMVTNPNKTVIYTGVTNNLGARLIEHWNNRGKQDTFAGKYFCYNLIYYEKFQYITSAIERETELKKWNRGKKEMLIAKKNSDWNFLNKQFCNTWPPIKIAKRF